VEKLGVSKQRCGCVEEMINIEKRFFYFLEVMMFVFFLRALLYPFGLRPRSSRGQFLSKPICNAWRTSNAFRQVQRGRNLKAYKGLCTVFMRFFRQFISEKRMDIAHSSLTLNSIMTKTQKIQRQFRTCHSKRSEQSPAAPHKILRCAQNGNSQNPSAFSAPLWLT
jgi:hypothetical protein